MSAQQCVGVAEHYTAFVKLCRLRIKQLGITYDVVDEICGFPNAYTSKLLVGLKGMSAFSLFTLARGLALLPAFHHDDAELIRLKAHSKWKPMTRAWRKRGGKIWSPKIELCRDLFRKSGQEGGLARARKLTRKQRRVIAKKAVAARKWRPVKERACRIA